LVRAFGPQDVPAVAGLFQRLFRDRRDDSPDLRAYFRELFLTAGRIDPELPSYVFIDQTGEVVGFVGVILLVMTLGGRAIRAAVPTSLMVKDPRRHPFAAMSLLRAFLNGPQQLSLTDTASPEVRALWLRLGGATADAYGMDWWRILRPAGFAACRIGGGRLSPVLPALARAADQAFEAIAQSRSRFQIEPAPARSEDVADPALIGLFAALTDRIALKPDWTSDGLPWRLEHAARRAGHGALFRRVVFVRGKPVGCYLYNARDGEIARVIELVAQPSAYGVVLADLAAHARAAGAVALRGRTRPDLASALIQARCFYTHRLSALVHTREPEILAAVTSGNALLTGLSGDTWTRLFDDRFA
jgi:hypothetical protein